MQTRTLAETTDKNDRKLISDIAAYGHHVVMIAEDEEGPGYAFTVGLFATHGHPEVVVFGMPMEFMHELLNHLGEMVASGKVFRSGATYPGILKRYRCAFIDVPPGAYAEYLGYATWFYRGDGFPAQQLVWPDTRQRFPWDSDADEAIRELQPLLGQWSDGDASAQ